MGLNDRINNMMMMAGRKWIGDDILANFLFQSWMNFFL